MLLLCAEVLGIALLHGVARTFDYRALYAAGHISRTAISHLYDLGLQKAVEETLVSPGGGLKPFYHPAFEALLFAPFSLLRYGPSYLVFIAANCILLGFAYLAGPRHSAFPFAKNGRALAFFTFLPVLLTIIDGQDSILFLLLCCLAFRRLEKHDEWGAGILLGLGIFRPQLAVPIALLLGLRYGRRILTSFITVSALLAGISILLVRKAGVTALTSLISTISLAGNHSPAVQDAMAVYPQRMPNLYGLIYICGARHLAPHSTFLITMVASVAVFACCAWVVRNSKSAAISFSIAVVGACLISYHSAAYDVAILVLPILLLSERIQRYLVVACDIVPYLLFFCGLSDWFALLAPVELALLIAAAVHVLRSRVRVTANHKELVTA